MLNPSKTNNKILEQGGIDAFYGRFKMEVAKNKNSIFNAKNHARQP